MPVLVNWAVRGAGKTVYRKLRWGKNWAALVRVYEIASRRGSNDTRRDRGPGPAARRAARVRRPGAAAGAPAVAVAARSTHNATSVPSQRERLYVSEVMRKYIVRYTYIQTILRVVQKILINSIK